MSPPPSVNGNGSGLGDDEGRPGRLDPGRLAVMQDSFDFVCEEMGRSLRRTAFSPTSRRGSTRPAHCSTRAVECSPRPNTSPYI